MPEAVDRIARLRAALPDHVNVQVDGGIDHRTIGLARESGATLFVAGSAIFGERAPGAGVPQSPPGPRVSHFERALELAERGRGKTGDHPARRRRRRAGRRGRGGGLVRVRRSPPRGDHRARAGRGRRARRDPLRDARAVLPPRPHASLRRRRGRRRDRARRRRRPRPESGRRRPRARAPSGRGGRGRAPRRPRRAPAERGLARLEVARAPVRHLQGSRSLSTAA